MILVCLFVCLFIYLHHISVSQMLILEVAASSKWLSKLTRKGPDLQGIYVKLQYRKFNCNRKQIYFEIYSSAYIYIWNENLPKSNIKPQALVIIDTNHRTRVSYDDVTNDRLVTQQPVLICAEIWPRKKLNHSMTSRILFYLEYIYITCKFHVIFKMSVFATTAKNVHPNWRLPPQCSLLLLVFIHEAYFETLSYVIVYVYTCIGV